MVKKNPKKKTAKKKIGSAGKNEAKAPKAAKPKTKAERQAELAKRTDFTK